MQTFGWSDDGMELAIEVDPIGAVRLTRLAGGPAPAVGDAGPARSAAGLPLVDIVLAGEGRAWSGDRGTASPWPGGGCATRATTRAPTGTAGSELRVDLADPVTGLRAEVCYRILAGPGRRCASWVRLTQPRAPPG